MAVSLGKEFQRGEKVSLSKLTADQGITTALTKIAIGLGWKPQHASGEDFDLDASVFMVDVNGRTTDERFIYYGHRHHIGDKSYVPGTPFYSKDGSIHHSGDNRKGDGPEQDDEVITITLADVPADVVKLAVVITIFDAENRKQTFGQVDNALARVYDVSTGQKVQIGSFDMSEENSLDRAMHVCDIYRTTEGSQDWKFKAAGAGQEEGLAAVCQYFGLEVK